MFSTIKGLAGIVHDTSMLFSNKFKTKTLKVVGYVGAVPFVIATVGTVLCICRASGDKKKENGHENAV